MAEYLTELLNAIAQSPPAVMMRGSFWVYPLVNAGHILGVALLIGAIVPLDLRLVGLFKRGRLKNLAAVLVPVAASGLALAAVTGALLFIVKPAEYVATDLFLFKIAVIGVGLINIAAVRANPRWAEIVQADESLLNPTEPDGHLQAAGAVSLVAWVSVLVLGRLVGYFL